MLRELRAPCNPWFPTRGRLTPDTKPGCAAGDDDPISPTTPPPNTTTVSSIAAPNDFLERIAKTGSRFYDEGLSERSDKSIYDEKAILATLASSCTGLGSRLLLC